MGPSPSQATGWLGPLQATLGVPLVAADASDSDPTLACGQLSNLVLLGFSGASSGVLVPGNDSQHLSVQLVWEPVPFWSWAFRMWPHCCEAEDCDDGCLVLSTFLVFLPVPWK